VQGIPVSYVSYGEMICNGESGRDPADTPDGCRIFLPGHPVPLCHGSTKHKDSDTALPTLPASHGYSYATPPDKQINLTLNYKPIPTRLPVLFRLSLLYAATPQNMMSTSLHFTKPENKSSINTTAKLDQTPPHIQKAKKTETSCK
jgi:hypothetical protein